MEISRNYTLNIILTFRGATTLEKNMNSIVEVLCKYVEYNDLENVQKLLDQG